MPSKWKSGGGKCHQIRKVMAGSATTFQIWWNLSHYISNRGGALTTTYYIQGAGAPAKTKNYVNADDVYIFSGKGPTFSASCKTSEHYEFHACMEMSSVNAKYTEHVMRGAKPMNTFLRKVGKAMVQMKRDWFDTALENYERGETHGRWKEKIQI